MIGVGERVQCGYWGDVEQVAAHSSTSCSCL